MPEKNAARIDHRRFEAGPRHEPHLSRTNDPQQGARLSGHSYGSPIPGFGRRSLSGR